MSEINLSEKDIKCLEALTDKYKITASQLVSKLVRQKYNQVFVRPKKKKVPSIFEVFGTKINPPQKESKDKSE